MIDENTFVYDDSEEPLAVGNVVVPAGISDSARLC